MGTWADARRFGLALLAAAASLVALAIGAASTATGATTNGFSLGVSSPALVRNAVVLVKISCPRSQARCSGATIVYSPSQPTAPQSSLQRGILIAPAQPFSLRAGKSMTLRLLIPLSAVGVLRQVRQIPLVSYTLAANGATGGYGSFFTTNTPRLANHDRRLYGLHRLRLRLSGVRLSNGKLQVTAICTGASSKAKASAFGGCEGLIDVFGGSRTSSPPRLVALGAGAFILKQDSTAKRTIRLAKRRFAQISREPAPYLVVYSIASDRVDQLGAAQLVTKRVPRTG